jgi:hypothetical protein
MALKSKKSKPKTTSYWKSEIKRANAILKRAGAK